MTGVAPADFPEGSGHNNGAVGPTGGGGESAAVVTGGLGGIAGRFIVDPALARGRLKIVRIENEGQFGLVQIHVTSNAVAVAHVRTHPLFHIGQAPFAAKQHIPISHTILLAPARGLGLGLWLESGLGLG